MSSELEKARQREINKYTAAYRDEKYRMGESRLVFAAHHLASVPFRDGYLEVGCGRGELLLEAGRLGYIPVAGVEPAVVRQNHPGIVRKPFWDMPWSDKSFDVVGCFDVLEHLLPQDGRIACETMLGLARKVIFLTVANWSSKHDGEELHITQRPYDGWNTLFESWFEGCKVTWLPKSHGHSAEGWRIDVT